MGALPSPLNVALLGLLIERPGYGYELAKRLHDDFNPGWRLEFSNVYSVLDSLERDALVVRREDAPDHRSAGSRMGPRIFYTVTDLGAERFEQWMKRGCRRKPVRDELLAKLAVARPQHVPILMEQLDELEREILDALRQLDHVTQRDGPPPPSGSWKEAFNDVMTDKVERSLQADLDWVAHARQRFERFRDPATWADQS